MSIAKEFSAPAAWLTFGELYFGIGIAPYGQPDLGTVAYATLVWEDGLEPTTCYLRTATPCREEDTQQPHLLTRASPQRCTRCDRVFQPIDPATFTHGFKVVLGATGQWQVNVSNYQRSEHGPFGASTHEAANALAEHALADHLRSYGATPFYIVHYDDGIRTKAEPISSDDLDLRDFNNVGNAFHYPVARLEDALRIAHEATHDSNGVRHSRVPDERGGWHWTDRYRTTTTYARG
jgi:hypothetical protein